MNNTEQPKAKALKPIEEVRNSLTRMSGQFQMALPHHIPVDKFIRVAQTAISSSPNLLKADRASLFAACTKAAQAGLLPDGKESAMVPYKETVVFIPMVAGILKLVRNSGELSSITAQIVHEKDVFNYWIDEKGEHLEHRPNLLSDRGDAVGTYALAILKDGAVYIEFLTRAQVMAVKNVSRSASSGPWAGPFEHEMWKKTAIRRLAKRLPLSTDLDGVFQADNELYNLDEQPEPSEAPKKTKSSRLGKLMGDMPNDIPEEREALSPEPPIAEEQNIPI